MGISVTQQKGSVYKLESIFSFAFATRQEDLMILPKILTDSSSFLGLPYFRISFGQYTLVQSIFFAQVLFDPGCEFLLAAIKISRSQPHQRPRERDDDEHHRHDDDDAADDESKHSGQSRLRLRAVGLRKLDQRDV